MIFLYFCFREKIIQKNTILRTYDTQYNSFEQRVSRVHTHIPIYIYIRARSELEAWPNSELQDHRGFKPR